MDASKLEGRELDGAVATIEIAAIFAGEANRPRGSLFCNNASTDWAHGGPILERNPWALPRVNTNPGALHLGKYAASTPGGFDYYGETPLVASMRAIVAALWTWS